MILKKKRNKGNYEKRGSDVTSKSKGSHLWNLIFQKEKEKKEKKKRERS